jgi:hypothetical protein
MLKWLLKWFSAHPMAHVPDITVERAAEIKTLYERGEFTQKELGAMFGVHQSQISASSASGARRRPSKLRQRRRAAGTLVPSCVN